VDQIRAIFAGKKRIAVIDRNISIGMGGCLWTDTLAFADPGAVVQNYLAGLGGGDVRPEYLVKLVADLTLRNETGAPALMEAV